MDFKIIWARAALRDLQEIVEYIAAKSPQAAQRTGEAVVRSVEVLSEFPLIGPAYPRGTQGKLREIVCGNYRIFYCVAPNSIEVMRIWHAARGTPPSEIQEYEK